MTSSYLILITSRLTYLDVFAASDFGEVFLCLVGLVGSVVGRRGTHDTQSSLDQVSTLDEHKELAEERHSDQLPVQLGRHPGHLRETLTVEQPEPADQSQPELSSRERAVTGGGSHLVYAGTGLHPRTGLVPNLLGSTTFDFANLLPTPGSKGQGNEGQKPSPAWVVVLL